ncbi:MAG TPA: peroxidase-related enzyme [Castellaniella sp.]|uniref:peroxidase-related enzyme n=1 Tax=Castellaniella sp. TaxID=1955812 RepID=UPI002EF1879C
MSTFIQKNGFTDEPLGWQSWLRVVKPEQATPEQLAVLEMSHPQARTSDYYLTLIHQPGLLERRSEAYNAIMYAPGGLPRAERELAALTVSRINGCVYCSSVHSQRFEQLAKRNDTVAQVFDDPLTAGVSDRERAITRFAARLTTDPSGFGAADVQPLKDLGLTDLEVLDLLHVVSIFAWANRLMMNLGEPVPASL